MAGYNWKDYRLVREQIHFHPCAMCENSWQCGKLEGHLIKLTCPTCRTLPRGQAAIIGQIVDERKRQDAKFGWPRLDHVHSEWLTILTEEVGEYAKAINEADTSEHIRKELVQIAAVAVLILEHMDLGRGVQL